MSNEIKNNQIAFIESKLPELILKYNDELSNFKFVSCMATKNVQLDGFMSSIFSVELVLQELADNKPKLHQLIVKIMKGDESFRALANAPLLCSNEIYIYKNIIPFFRKFLKDSKATLFNPDEWWTPRIYFADFDYYPDIGYQKEAILALENIKPAGFRMGPKVDLDEDHLRLMIRNIAYYHSVSYALKIKEDPTFKKLTEGLDKFSFLSETGEENALYKRLFVLTLERLFDCIDRNESYQNDKKFIAKVKEFKSKYLEQPMILMESFLKYDGVFSAILHGDYNRNNVLFRYDSPDGFSKPNAIKMIDFQEVRYSTPAIDLTFFMYANIHRDLRDQVWDSLLEHYHETLIASLMDILKCDKNDPQLTPYSFNNFIDHFRKHACYGVPVGLHFIPWIASSEEELQKISHLHETDMNGEAFRDILQICGGKEVDDRMTSVAKHAFDKGYLNII